MAANDQHTPTRDSSTNRILQQWSAPSKKRHHSPCFRHELEYESNEILLALEDAHEVFIELVRYYRRIVNTRAVRDELKALSMIFFAPSVECKICESSAGIERVDCWDVAGDDGDNDNQQYNGYVCEVFGHVDDRPERCRSVDEMQNVCAGPVLPVLAALLLRTHSLSTRISTHNTLRVSDTVRGLSEGFTDQVHTVQRLNAKMEKINEEFRLLEAGAGLGAE